MLRGQGYGDLSIYSPYDMRMLIFQEIPVRFPTLIIAAFMSSSSVTLATEPLTEVVLISGGPAQLFTGTLEQGTNKTFTYSTSTDRSVTMIIHARNEDCGAEMRSNAQHGFMSDFGRFPTTRVERAKAGETFKVSLHQTRAGRMNRTVCDYSISFE